MEAKPADRVLIVDDDRSIRWLLNHLLENAGYECIEASDANEAYRRVLDDRPQIILTDWYMPGMSGLELVERIRATELDWYPYILLVTASEDQQTGLDSGADDFITKPIKAEQVLPRVRAGQRIVSLQESLRKKNLLLNENIDRLAKLAVADPMTGLLNRRAFREAAEREWKRAERYNLPLTCVMIDIDLFKRINDTYGHAAGDLVICRMGELLKQRFRDTDIICRYGGEEFCLLLTNTVIQEGTRIAERLRQIVAAAKLPEIGEDFSFTVSCGLATRSFNTLTVEALIDLADQALLVAKRTGRNRVVGHEEIETSLSLFGAEEVPVNPGDRRDVGVLIPYQIVNTLLTVLNHRDSATLLHSQRVARLCKSFGHHLALDPAERLTLEIAALLHDIGKLTLPDEILNKSGRLSDEEYAVAQRHRAVSIDLLSSCFSNQKLLDIVRYSGQAYDGTRGEPAGEDIPLGSRILAVTSLYDDVRYGRAWWQPHTAEDALIVLTQMAGKQLDPSLVTSFIEMMRREDESLAPPLGLAAAPVN